MPTRRIVRLVALFAPLLVFAVVSALPDYWVRLSLLCHGHPFARVVPKENLDIFKFVSTDNLACRALVFSDHQPLGWVLLPTTGGFPEYVPFSANPNLKDGALPTLPVCVYIPLTIAWILRWWLLALAIVWIMVNLSVIPDGRWRGKPGLQVPSATLRIRCD